MRIHVMYWSKDFTCPKKRILHQYLSFINTGTLKEQNLILVLGQVNGCNLLAKGDFTGPIEKIMHKYLS